MLVFIDEHGDTGVKFNSGSTPHLIVSAVVFLKAEHAEKCAETVRRVRRELEWTEDSEFHFSKNSDRVRLAFLEAISHEKFTYFAFVLNKKNLWSLSMKDPDRMYSKVCEWVVGNAQSYLRNASVFIDKRGGRDLKQRLKVCLRALQTPDGQKLVKKVSMISSRSNSLIQLADYVAGALGRFEKHGDRRFLEIIVSKNRATQRWP